MSKSNFDMGSDAKFEGFGPWKKRKKKRTKSKLWSIALWVNCQQSAYKRACHVAVDIFKQSIHFYALSNASYYFINESYWRMLENT